VVRPRGAKRCECLRNGEEEELVGADGPACTDAEFVDGGARFFAMLPGVSLACRSSRWRSIEIRSISRTGRRELVVPDLVK